MFDAPTQRIIPSSRVCRVHLLRHGEVEGPRGRVCRGQSDDPLSALGQRRSAAIAAWFRTQPAIDALYSSDLSRCRDLAVQLGDPELSPALREQHMGTWDGRTWAELTEADPSGTLAWWNDYVNARPPGGESFGEVHARVVAWWEGAPRDGNVVVVTHIGVIRALVCHWLGLGPDQGLRWAPGYATHTEVLLAEAGAVVERFGERIDLAP